MTNFYGNALADRAPWHRYEGYWGYELWREYGEARSLAEADEFLRRLIAVRRDVDPPHCPRVFVSHKQQDAAEALRIGYIARGAGFEFWLDLLDQDLTPASTWVPYEFERISHASGANSVSATGDVPRNV